MAANVFISIMGRRLGNKHIHLKAEPRNELVVTGQVHAPATLSTAKRDARWANVQVDGLVM